MQYAIDIEFIDGCFRQAKHFFQDVLCVLSHGRSKLHDRVHARYRNCLAMKGHVSNFGMVHDSDVPVSETWVIFYQVLAVLHNARRNAMPLKPSHDLLVLQITSPSFYQSVQVVLMFLASIYGLESVLR